MSTPAHGKGFWHTMQRPWRSALGWPSVCHVCHAWPCAALCTLCIERFAQPTRRCPTCALTLTQPVCSHCAQQPNPLDACVAAVSYTFPWSDCIAQFKFQADPGLGRALADVMRHAPWVEPAIEQAQQVFAMPLSAARLQERGFNQAYELARHLAPRKADAHTLRRSGDAPHQVGASREDRLRHVDGMFWVDPQRVPAVRGQRVVLIDDVMTTGASLYEAARTLRTAGAAHITGLVFARTEARAQQ
jgi:ComF family protein